MSRKNFSISTTEKVFTRFLGKCADCGKLAHPSAGHQFSHFKLKTNHCFSCGGLEIHHIIPVQQGGKNDITNLVLVCPDCHLKRHGKVRRKKEGWWH